jgi:hypothetical protein
MNAATLSVDTVECESFVRLWLELTGAGHITLTAIPAAGGATTTATFAPIRFEAMTRWLEIHQAVNKNVYFQVNETHPRCARKPAKGDIIAALCRHADVDPMDDDHPYFDERDRLHRLGAYLHNSDTLPPTMVLDSGNGIYPLWVVTRQLLTPGVQQAVEAENRAIEAALGAAGTFNIDRLLRLPGTLNYPNAKKMRLGRGVTRARMLHHSDRVYTGEQASGLGGHLAVLLRDVDLVRRYVGSTESESPRRKEGPKKRSTRSRRDRSATALRKGAALYRAGRTFEEMCAALAADADTADWTSDKGEANDRRELRRIWEKAERDANGGECAHGRPLIRLVAGQLHTAATAGEAGIIKAGQPIFQRGNALVRPIIREVTASRGRTTNAAGLSEQNAHALIDLFSATADWERYDERSSEWIPTNPPMQVAQILLSRQGLWRFPPIAGVITCPTLKPDGSILLAPGYDPHTKLYHVVDDTLELHPDLHRPTRELALRALEFLSGLLAEFPFVTIEEVGRPDQHAAKAVALSALITPVVRGAIGVAPLHAFRATTAGSGKSYLVDVVSAICAGRPCPVISAAPDDAETEKRVAGLLLAGYPLVTIDNVNGELGGDLLCQAIERPLIRIRPLGGSEIIEIENTATLLATGNQMHVRGDMVRRTLIADLDAGLERPELREFRNDPVATVLAKRGAYVSACLMIARAYIVAGWPEKLPPIASFADWSDLIRSALVWLGCDDPALSMELARADDPDLGETREMITVWREVLGCGESFTAREIAEKAEEHTQTRMGEPTDYAHPEFRELLLRLFGDRGMVNTRRLGRWLLSRERRIVSGHRLIRCGTASGGVARWAVQLAGQQ